MKRPLHVLVGVVLVLLVIGLFSPVFHHEFVSFDDPDYITLNTHIRHGFTPESLAWAFTSTSQSNWHPLTWLSHMLDVQLHGLDPGGHHGTNLLFHAATTVLLFAVLAGLTGALWCSAAVALLFAVHPLHVESVAWVAERKDLLCAFFSVLTLWGYGRYARRPGWGKYALVVLFFVLALLAKPMAVTLPFVMLLLDYWPLNRLGGAGTTAPVASLGRVIAEKLPLFLLTAASAAITYVVQNRGGAVASLEQTSFLVHAGNALISYVAYLGKAFWPVDLAAFYPLDPAAVTPARAGAAALFLLAVTVTVLRARRRRPWLAVGWLWYLGTLVPVIGLVRIGAQAMADRYTYFPLIGIFVMVAWGGAELVQRWRLPRTFVSIAALLVFSILMTATWRQLQYWRTSIALFEHALAVTPGHPVAYTNLGIAYGKAGRIDEAIDLLQQAVRIDPGYKVAHFNLGLMYLTSGQREATLAEYAVLARLDPGSAENLGRFMRLMGWGVP